MSDERTWTVAELVAHLQTMPQELKVVIVGGGCDYDGQEFSKYSVRHCVADNDVTFFLYE